MLSHEVSFVNYVYVPNSMSVEHFLLVETFLGLVGDHPGDVR